MSRSHRFQPCVIVPGIPYKESLVRAINAHWNTNVAYIGNDNEIKSTGNLVNGVPIGALDGTYRHEDIVWVKWNGKSLQFTRR